MQQHNLAGKPVTPNTPWLVDNVFQAFDTVKTTAVLNLVENVKDAAGSTVIIQLPGRRVFTEDGTKIGSYWGGEENLQYSTPERTPSGSTEDRISGVVLTDGTAAVAIYDATFDLEKIFESATRARYVLKLTDVTGKAYYGFIGGVAAASNVYTFTIYSEVTLANQNWVKTWGSGIAGPYAKAEIFEYTTSFTLAAADTFAEELPYSPHATDYNQLKSLSNGQYMIDYLRGRFLGRKLDDDNTETATYRTLVSANSEPVTNAITNFTKTITTAGTPLALAASSTPVKKVVIVASQANTSAYVVVGGATGLDETAASRTGYPIAKNNSHVFYNVDLADIYADVGTNGDKVHGYYIT